MSKPQNTDYHKITLPIFDRLVAPEAIAETRLSPVVAPTLEILPGLGGGPGAWVTLIDQMLGLALPLTATATSYTLAFGSYSYDITGSGFGYTDLDGMDLLSSGTIDGFTVSDTGTTVLTGANMALDAAELFAAIQADGPGNPDAIETLIYGLDWTFVDSDNNGGIYPFTQSLGGSPVLFTGDNIVHLNGGAQDWFDLGPGNDTLYGGNGTDYAFGGIGNDVMDGGNGGDGLAGNAGNDIIRGGAGQDELYGNLGNDTIRGGAQSDYIEGGRGNDDISGGRGDDLLDGGLGADVVRGGAGMDLIFGDAGRDVLNGGDDADLIIAGDGIDTLTGGEGADHFAFTADDGRNIITDFEDGVDFIVWENDIAYTEVDTGNGLQLSYDGGSVLLLGMSSADFDAADVKSQADTIAFFDLSLI